MCEIDRRWLLGSWLNRGENALWKKTRTPVTTITVRRGLIGDTPVVNMVRKASKKSFLRAGRHEAAVERGSRC
jgi:hypothetical protein